MTCAHSPSVCPSPRASASRSRCAARATADGGHGGCCSRGGACGSGHAAGSARETLCSACRTCSPTAPRLRCRCGRRDKTCPISTGGGTRRVRLVRGRRCRCAAARGRRRGGYTRSVGEPPAQDPWRNCAQKKRGTEGAASAVVRTSSAFAPARRIAATSRGVKARRRSRRCGSS